MKIIAVANMKGGVGKTTTSIMLSDALTAMGGKRVLSLDLDSQANLSWALMSPSRLDEKPHPATMTRWLEDVRDDKETSFTEMLEEVGLKEEREWLPNWWSKKKNSALRLAVSNTDMRFVEMSFEGPLDKDPAEKLASRLKSELAALKIQHDYVVMDCSPALSALTRAGLKIADLIIIPTPLNRLCFSSFRTFQEKALNGPLNISHTPVYVVATRVGAASGKKETTEVRKRLREGQSKEMWRFLSAEIREAVDYTNALSPPITGPHQTLKSRYGSKLTELKNFLNSLQAEGVLEND